MILAHSEVHKKRREALLKQIKDGVAVIPGTPDAHMYRGLKFRQASDFYYLTGWEDANAVLVLAPDHPKHKYVLFVQAKNWQEELWVGLRPGLEGATADYGADIAYSHKDLDKEILQYLENTETLYYTFGADEAFDRRVQSWLTQTKNKNRLGIRAPKQIIETGKLVHAMRRVKDDHELSILRKATVISAGAHVAAMKACRPGMYEYELEAVLLNHFYKNGGSWPAYASIVGTGGNAVILHYNKNRSKIEDGHLVLIDAAVEYEYYCSDITRTFPANGRFTKPQREIYELVLKAQTEAIKIVKPGLPYNEIHKRAVQVLVEGLLRLGILKGDAEKIIQDKTYATCYPHNTGHWLGLDTHDVGDYRDGESWARLEPGMVFTVEPGLYFKEGLEGVDSKYYNIGVRVEDDVLVTATGSEVLTSGVPKDMDAIEDIMSKRQPVSA